MENQNNNQEKNKEKKQIILMVLCILILIVAVVGVSTAFFTFFKEGTTENVITTGKIVFNFDDKTTGKVDPETGEVTPGDLVVTNDEPMSDDEGKGRDDKFGFDIDAKLPENMGKEVEFKVYAIAGDVPSQEEGYQKPDGTKYEEKDRLDYKYISMYVEPNTFKSTKGDDVSSTIVAKYKTGDYKLEDTTNGKKVLIASGKIPDDNKEHTFAYMLSMWINKDLNVSDTDAKAPYRASKVETSNLLPKDQEEDTRPVYSDLFFSLKIRIEAGDSVGIGG